MQQNSNYTQQHILPLPSIMEEDRYLNWNTDILHMNNFTGNTNDHIDDNLMRLFWRNQERNENKQQENKQQENKQQNDNQPDLVRNLPMIFMGEITLDNQNSDNNGNQNNSLIIIYLHLFLS